MKIEKKSLGELKRCYCAGQLKIKDKLHVVLASEDPGYSCYATCVEDLNQKELIWDGPGGTMSLLPLEDKKEEFLAVQEFYLKVSPSLAKLVWGKKEDGKWILRDVLHLPYLHRFDVYRVNGVSYFIGATIAEEKADKEDWSHPGKIYVGLLPKDLSQGIELKVLKDGLFRNHGYSRIEENGIPCGLFSSDQGVFKCVPPSHENEDWKVEKVLDGAIGEIAATDIDQDGNLELMTIEPFHGDRIKIYKKIEGEFTPVYTYPYEIDFAHALVGCQLRGVNSFVGGVRRKDAELFYVQYQDGRFVTERIDLGGGPANLQVINEENRDLIVAANHTRNEAALYLVED